MAAPSFLHFEQTPAHQRPDEVPAQWLLKDPDEWDIHEQIAAATHGIGTLAMGATLTGAAITIRGIDDICKGIETKSQVRFGAGLGLVGAGRGLDLVDGFLAKKYKVTSDIGALADASVDKILVGYALKRFMQAGIVSKAEVAIIAAEQAVIAGESVLIESLGGKANPSHAGKMAMFSLWGYLTARATEHASAAFGYEGLETSARRVARISNVATHALTAVAITQYGVAAVRAHRSQDVIGAEQ